MASKHINPSTDKYILEGRVVTMGPRGVLPRGAIYIEAGEIKAVREVSEDPIPGFETATRVKTGDTIYPGMIELHNHLSYNAIPLWDVPRKYSNNGMWRNNSDEYRRLVSKPCQVLGRTSGVIEALVRFVECRCLLGGVTTSQGVTLQSAPGIKKFYKGIVRNVEQPMDKTWPAAETRIANPKTGKAQAFLDNLQKYKQKDKCYLVHLSEGIDDTARGWFQRLQLKNGDWAINEALCGIHCTALRAEDFELMSAKGASMVWSPLSNFLLYGDTADIRAAKDAGILISLGSDWAPSGSKNLLGELKVAWLVSEKLGGVFTADELVSMVTINAARIVNWDKHLGAIEPNKRADLLAINGQQGDDYMRLIEARETSITLVVIDGIPRVGQKRLMKAFSGGQEEISIGDSERILNLEQEDAFDLVQELTLKDATERLQEVLENLPEYARQLDEAVASSLFMGSLDDQGTAWRVVFELEEETVDFDLAAEPLADQVQPMELEVITVADDPIFLPKLVAARNLPEYIKKGLPGLYGQKVPLPDSARFLLQKKTAVHESVVDTTRDLKTFLRTSGELRWEDRKRIVDQALVLLEQIYVHLPLKQSMYAVDPVQRLKLFRHRLEERDEDLARSEIEFHNELTRTFNSLRDLHTIYRLPYPFKDKIAWLPFLIEECWDADQHKYLVTKLIGDVGPATFEEGVEVLYWNGTPIHKVVLQNADRQAGSNLAARLARGLNSLTIRSLASGVPPDEEWVTLKYRGLDGNEYEWTQEWLVFEPARGRLSLDMESVDESLTALGVDSQTDDIQEAKKLFFASKIIEAESNGKERASTKRDQSRRSAGAQVELDTVLPTVFRARTVTTSRGAFGYIRIFSFNVDDPGLFVEEFKRLILLLPDNGLILDVRGNGGGHIHAAERLLQLLTPRRIEPQRAQFINTPVTLQICRNHPSLHFPTLDLRRWVSSIEQSVKTGATYSLGYPITSEEACNAIGQKYYGPVVLVVDGLCYSATDMFAAGFQDHEIGTILGISDNTGAGGANVWSHKLMLELMRPTNDSDTLIPSPFAPLPHGADLRAAVRRTLRVGRSAGTIVEDLGIKPNVVHRMTKRDILESNNDLIETAAGLLAGHKSYNLTVEVEPHEPALPDIVVTTRHVTRLDVYLNKRPYCSYDVGDAPIPINLGEVMGDYSQTKLMVELRGFENGALVAVWRDDILSSHLR